MSNFVVAHTGRCAISDVFIDIDNNHKIYMLKYLSLLVLGASVLCSDTDETPCVTHNSTLNAAVLAVCSIISLLITGLYAAMTVHSYRNFGKYKYVLPVVCAILLLIYYVLFILGIYREFEYDNVFTMIFVNFFYVVASVLLCAIVAVVGPFIKLEEISYDTVEFDL